MSAAEVTKPQHYCTQRLTAVRYVTLRVSTAVTQSRRAQLRSDSSAGQIKGAVRCVTSHGAAAAAAGGGGVTPSVAEFLYSSVNDSLASLLTQCTACLLTSHTATLTCDTRQLYSTAVLGVQPAGRNVLNIHIINTQSRVEFCRLL